MALIAGKDILSEPLGGQPLVEIRGLERSVEVDENGDFQMMVPAGWRSLHFSTPGSSELPHDTLIHFNIGEQKEFIGHHPFQPTHCENIECELAIVKELLDSNGITTIQPESVVVITDNHVTELHLNELNLTVIPASIGELFHLEILDISDNQIEELPTSIEKLQNLKSIKADHNNIWSIPASIGMLKSLEFLDFAFNNLQTLPEPITYLSLNRAFFGFNMLCNIGERTIEWLWKVDKGWHERQDCH